MAREAPVATLRFEPFNPCLFLHMEVLPWEFPAARRPRASITSCDPALPGSRCPTRSGNVPMWAENCSALSREGSPPRLRPTSVHGLVDFCTNYPAQ